jgi:hypothetical protein
MSIRVRRNQIIADATTANIVCNRLQAAAVITSEADHALPARQTSVCSSSKLTRRRKDVIGPNITLNSGLGRQDYVRSLSDLQVAMEQGAYSEPGASIKVQVADRSELNLGLRELYEQVGGVG